MRKIVQTVYTSPFLASNVMVVVYFNLLYIHIVLGLILRTNLNPVFAASPQRT